jgi:hypothetical protein
MATPLGADRPDVSNSAAVPALWRAPLLILGFGALIVGVGAGLVRLGIGMPAGMALASPQHGVLMIGGFFGVVISLERAVAIDRSWGYLAPLLAAFGAVAAIAGESELARWLFFVASVALLAASLSIVRRQPALFTLTIMLGALCWLVGNLFWAAGSTMAQVSTWWLAFPIFTIAGERLELSRFLPPSPLARGLFAAIIAVIFAGMLAGQFNWGTAAWATGLLALSAWLAKQDIARRTVRKQGLTRFIAVCLLSGYAWLAIGAVIVLLSGDLSPGSTAYDGAVHALALGFVFSMVFGHAPMIFPAVLRVEVPYRSYFYIPLGLLQVSLLVRLIGDASGQLSLTRTGGMLNALALAAFVIGTAVAAVHARVAARRLAG